MIFFLALRNLVRNRKHSIIILLLFIVIISLFFLGNSILEQTNRGLKQSYMENYTGDLVIKARSSVGFSLLGANIPSIEEYFSIPVIKNHHTILEVLSDFKAIENRVSQVSGAASLNIFGRNYNVPLFGIEGDEYLPFFPGIEILSGEGLKTGEKGIMMTSGRADQIESDTGRRPVPGDAVLLTLVGDRGFKIREVPIRGIFSYQNGDVLTDQILLVDVQTQRALNSITLASESDTENQEELISGSIDDLFGESDGDSAMEQDDSFSVDSILSLLSSPGEPEKSELVGGGWNFILIKLHKGYSPRKLMKRLNDIFDEKDLDVEVINWRNAAGLSALMVFLLQVLYNGGFLLVLFAGVIAIVNILIISVFKRTSEIGTLRAIGASRPYIALMFYIENIILAMIAGIVVVLSGIAILHVINSLEIHITNKLIASLLGNQSLHVTFIPSIALVSMITSLLLGFLSTIYPVSMALKIEPAGAVAKG